MHHRDMKALAENSDRVRALAAFLLKQPDNDAELRWTDWELDFLDSMLHHAGPEPLTMRQVEVLVELRDEARSFDKLDGLSVPSLINQCWLARQELDEDDEAFIDRLKTSGVRRIKFRQAGRLIACARQLDIVERYVALDRTAS